MKVCPDHWEELKQVIKAKGLYDFVAGNGKEAMSRILGQFEGERETKQNFDPLMACNSLLWGNALKCGGLALMGTDETGGEFCPVCEAYEHDQQDWINLVVNVVEKHIKTLPDS
jgi:hypothetical protein